MVSGKVVTRMQRSNIEWLNHPVLGQGMTWNPIAMRCTPLSRGCANCWHLAFAKRHAKNPVFTDEVRAAYAGGSPVIRYGELAAPSRRKKPTMIAVQLMGDLFHESISLNTIVDVFSVMTRTPHHLYVVLTKRLDRTVELFGERTAGLRANDVLGGTAGGRMMGFDQPWPLPNVIFLASIEDQESADERIPKLLQIPAVVHGISVEPMLSEVDLGPEFDGETLVSLLGEPRTEECESCSSTPVRGQPWCPGHDVEGGIGWAICGAENGPGKRPMSLHWARKLLNQCIAAEVPFFFKKDSSGCHTLDGETWEQFPEVKP